MDIETRVQKLESDLDRMKVYVWTVLACRRTTPGEVMRDFIAERAKSQDQKHP